MNGIRTVLPAIPNVGASRLSNSTSGSREALPTGITNTGMLFARSCTAASTGESFSTSSGAFQGRIAARRSTRLCDSQDLAALTVRSGASAEREFAVGEFARRQSAEAPERTVSAAKSWLSHSRVDRRAAILPWNAPDDVDKLSPVETAVRCLAHMVAAWQVKFPDWHPINRMPSKPLESASAIQTTLIAPRHRTGMNRI